MHCVKWVHSPKESCQNKKMTKINSLQSLSCSMVERIMCKESHTVQMAALIFQLEFSLKCTQSNCIIHDKMYTNALPSKMNTMMTMTTMTATYQNKRLFVQAFPHVPSQCSFHIGLASGCLETSIKRSERRNWVEERNLFLFYIPFSPICFPQLYLGTSAMATPGPGNCLECEFNHSIMTTATPTQSHNNDNF